MIMGSTSNWVLVGLLISVVGTISGWVAIGHYSRTELVGGWIVPDGAMTRIGPSRPGIVARLSVTEGQRVRPGDPMAAVMVQQGSADRADPLTDDLHSIDQQRDLVSHQIALSRQSETDEAAKLSASMAQSRIELGALDRQIELQRGIVESAKASFEPLTAVMQRGYFSRIQYEGKRQQYLAAQSQFAQLLAQRAQFSGQLRQAKVARAALPVQTAIRVIDLMTNQANLFQKRIEVENSRSYVITAPVAGRVSALQVSQGSTVSNQTPLMTIVNADARMVAELYAPSRAIGFTRVGQEVRLMYDAFPFQRFGSFAGRISTISRTVLAPNEVDAPIQGQMREPVYRIRVQIAAQSIQAFGEQIPLQPGMTLAANIVLDRRTFLEWLLDPINAVRNRS